MADFGIFESIVAVLFLLFILIACLIYLFVGIKSELRKSNNELKKELEELKIVNTDLAKHNLELEKIIRE